MENNDLDDHETNDDGSTIVCNICKTSLNPRENLTHFKTCLLNSKKRNFKCIICSETFQTKSSLSSHILSHEKVSLTDSQDDHEDELPKIHKCPHCEKHFGTESLVELHISLLHRNIEPNNTESELVTSTRHKISKIYSNIISEILYSSDSDCEYELIQTVVKVVPKETNYQCDFCKKSFTQIQSLKRHVRRHENSVETEVRSNIEQLGGGTFICPYCERTFKTSSSHSNHMKKHIKESVVKRLTKSKISGVTYTCQLCSKRFLSKLKFQNHLEGHKVNKNGSVVESVLKKHTCAYCGENFSTPTQLSVHLNTQHKNQSHICHVCAKEFTMNRQLVIHLKEHEEDTLICQYCSKIFTQKNNLSEHIRIHTGDKPYQCLECGKKFTHNSGLTQHLKTHTDVKEHECNVCNKLFRFPGHLKDHLRIHSGLKPFKCETCDKTFRNSSSLSVHERTHTGDRPFKCKTCNQGFIKSYGLQQHYKSHADHNTQNQLTQ